MSQCTDTVMMVRPARFGFNPEVPDNAFAARSTLAPTEISRRAVAAFDAMVDALRAHGVRVVVVQDTPEPETPDAVFPNNWISLHPDGRVVLWPMFAPSRRAERRLDVLDRLRAEGFGIGEVLDWTHHEREGRVCEGTGSLVLDHEQRVAYACRSQRTDAGLVDAFCAAFGLQPVLFDAFSGPTGARVPCYHTNVVMAVGEGAALWCPDAIDDVEQRRAVGERLAAPGRDVVMITEAQLGAFAGNALQLAGRDGPVWVLSRRAHDSLDPAQRQRLAATGRLLPVDLDLIETIGGGSARCMLAEVFSPRR